MPTLTDAELESLIAGRIAEANAALEANRNQLLKEKRGVERELNLARGLPVSGETAAERLLRQADAHKSRLHSAHASQGEPHVIPRSDARDPQKYQAAKDAAAEAGVSLLVGPDEPVVTRTADEALSPLKLVSDDNVLWASKKYQRSVGIQKLHALAASQGKTLRVFDRESELSEGARAQAEFIRKAGNPGHLYTAAEMAEGE